MSNTPDPTDTETTLEEDLLPILGDLRTLQGATDLVHTAITNGAAATGPFHLGDHGLGRLVPDGYRVDTIDVRQFDHETRLPSFPTQSHRFVGVNSLAQYLTRYQTDDTLAYVTDVYGQGAAMLCKDSTVATIVIDDHPSRTVAAEVDGAGAVGRQAHKAQLVLRPTAAAKRWGQALTTPRLDQEAFLDLVVDGIGEIGDPDGAVLRDLIQNLHALRSTEVTSVMRSGGDGEIVLAENVKLTAGQGDKVPFPENITIVLQPFAGVPDQITLKVRVKPVVVDSKVQFSLHSGEIDDTLARVVGSIADDLTYQTGLTAHWTP